MNQAHSNQLDWHYYMKEQVATSKTSCGEKYNEFWHTLLTIFLSGKEDCEKESRGRFVYIFKNM